MSGFNAKTVDVAQGKSYVIIGVVVIILIIVFVFGDQIIAIIKNIGGALGAAPPPKEEVDAMNAIRNADLSSETDPNGPFGQALYTNNPDASTLDYSTLKTMADNINSAVSILPDFIKAPDGAAMLAQIKMCNNQIDVSNLVVVFSQLHGDDLYDYMVKHLANSNGENIITMQQIISYVQKLPIQ